MFEQNYRFFNDGEYKNDFDIEWYSSGYLRIISPRFSKCNVRWTCTESKLSKKEI